MTCACAAAHETKRTQPPSPTGGGCVFQSVVHAARGPSSCAQVSSSAARNLASEKHALSNAISGSRLRSRCGSVWTQVGKGSDLGYSSFGHSSMPSIGGVPTSLSRAYPCTRTSLSSADPWHMLAAPATPSHRRSQRPTSHKPRYSGEKEKPAQDLRGRRT